ncbi:SigE family RNA polymerase sigma factor [Actinocrispum wychmicini]|uniref:RNA polymerase sigma-70 factor (Sigma-E family) n=1 Tax=Actinocrispum wychmicini TaxID=1213861 RepID=A0A4R2J0P6_9PSEU|nr:SigE family RNA polymerase sigma factor [Actinocrispum wychmicini]TCO48805.1 RNA polymerase sigma-70 factor (sigma-E family) [Actinocrispum wychmicini]
MGGTEDFDGYVADAWPRLLRSAWLLTGDWYLAEDLLQTALAKTYPRWRKVAGDHPDGYVRRILLTTYLSLWRRKWRGEIPTAELPDHPGTDEHAASDLRSALADVLRGLPRQQRAVLMLRFHCDLTEADTARVLGIGVGTVKSHTARALESLRARPGLRELLTEGALP